MIYFGMKGRALATTPKYREIKKHNTHPMPKIYIEEMTREQVINELRGQAHPQWFHSLLTWSTPHLKALLTYYKTSDEKPKTPTAGHTSKEGAEIGCGFCSYLENLKRPLSIVGIEIRVIKTCA